jgi:hypothetical protein
VTYLHQLLREIDVNEPRHTIQRHRSRPRLRRNINVRAMVRLLGGGVRK